MNNETATTEIEARESARLGYITNAFAPDSLSGWAKGLTVEELDEQAESYADESWFDYLAYDVAVEVGKWADAVEAAEFQTVEFERAVDMLAGRQHDALAAAIHKVTAAREAARFGNETNRMNISTAFDDLFDVLYAIDTEAVAR